ncbi:MAG TPA: hypothetical protein DIW43_02460 [Spongiibacteraceae bacterium]|nr:hypothetical protein [Spongiibacteraceae bacterium]
MKEEFKWYFPMSEDDINNIWNGCLLTVDANVLLDLYRYHESTRNTLIESLKQFNDRLWLSNQAAEEFIRNRTGVIVSSEKTFKKAKDEVEEFKNSLQGTISQLKGNRIIPDEIADGLMQKIGPAIDEALDKITESKSGYPKYLNDDPILEQLTELFRGAVGAAFSEEEIPGLIREAEHRVENKIPPGYMDDNKGDDRQYGDYLLWRQILDKSKFDDRSIIFVTSERKEDWWEKVSGKTIGPRPELLREAYDYTGKRILIYQTDRFIEYLSQRSGNTLNSDAVAEIRAVDMLRSDMEHAVEVVGHDVTKRTESSQEGVLVINLTRPVKNITGSGSFDPHLQNVPTINVILESAPDELGSYKLRAGAGTKFNFNLHVISAERNQLLPVGQYVLKYQASCDSPQSVMTTVKKLAKVVGIPTDLLIKQFLEAGVAVENEEDEVSNAQKQQLLKFLRSTHG